MTAVLRKLGLQGFHWLAFGNVTLKVSVSSQQLTIETSSLCLNFAKSVAYAEHVLFFWNSGILAKLGKRYECDLSPIKLLCTESLVSFPHTHIVHV